MIRLRASQLTCVSLLVLAACSASHQRNQAPVDAGPSDNGDATIEHPDGSAADGGESGPVDAAMNPDSGGTGLADGGGATAGETGSSDSGAADGGGGAGVNGAAGSEAGATGAGTTGAGTTGAGGDAAAGNGGSSGTTGETGGAGASGSAGQACGANDSACSPTDNVHGYCSSGTCASCASGNVGNASCSAAYGNGTGYVCALGDCVPGQCVANTDCGNGQLCGAASVHQCGSCQSDPQCVSSYGAGYLCIGGACVNADCRTDGDCPSGEICGLHAPNHCAGCESDGQCQNDMSGYGSGFICDARNQRCVSSHCSPNREACAANASDFCCGGSCVAGDCCNAVDCAGLGNNYTCLNHACTLCPLATNNTYYVDPVSGNDTIGTGNNSSAGCAFKTMTRALAVVGAAPNPGTKVYVLATGPIGTSASGETFPIDVPLHVALSGSGGRPQIAVPANTNGFLLHHPSSTLSNFSLDGQSHSAGYGIYVSAGSDATTSVASLDVQNMGQDGIRVAGSGVLTVLAGVHSTQNGTTSAAADGLHVADQAHATIVVTAGDAVHFDNNSAHGIYVTAAGSIELSGTAGSGGTGTITTNANTTAGLWIEQTPNASQPANSITGLVSWANSGNGIRIVAGSSALIRRSYVLANGSSGIIVSTYINGNTRSNDISRIDLGTSAGPSYGHNTVQASLGANPNAGAGICLSVDRTANVRLNAAGNVFSGATDCSLTAATLTKNNGCSGSVDYSVRGSNVNSIVLSNCH